MQAILIVYVSSKLPKLASKNFSSELSPSVMENYISVKKYLKVPYSYTYRVTFKALRNPYL